MMPRQEFVCLLLSGAEIHQERKGEDYNPRSQDSMNQDIFFKYPGSLLASASTLVCHISLKVYPRLWPGRQSTDAK